MKLEDIREIAMQLCVLHKDAPIVVGFSGGPDSLCLLDGLRRLGFGLVAAHFDHHLRPESSQDAQAARAIANQMNIPFHPGGGDVAAFARQEQLSLEEAARLLRYRFLFEVAEDCGAQAVAVGHTADDQVETVLMHLLRGTGLNGLKGMPYRAPVADWHATIPVVRPLLNFWHADTLAYCQEHGLHPVFDASNQNPVFFRNRLRLELIPYLEQYNPQARAALWRTAQILAGDAEVVQAAVQQVWLNCLERTGPAQVVLRLPVFRALLPGLQRGVLRQSIAHLLPGLRDLDYAAVERALEFTQRPAPAGSVDLVHGLRLWVEADRLMIAGTQPLPADPDWPALQTGVYPLDIPGELVLPGGWRLRCELLDWVEQPAGLAAEPALSKVGRWEAWFDAASMDEPLVVRAARPGDRFRPFGMQEHSRKLSDFWIDQKLPRRARERWPLVTFQDAILWVPGFRQAGDRRVTESTRKVLHLRLYSPGE